MTISPKLQSLMSKGNQFLGTDYPLICGAMTWVSEPKLVSAVCNSGCFACIAGGNAPVDILEQQIAQTRSMTDRNFAVNLITIAPAYRDQLAMLKDHKVPYIVFAGSFPNAKEVEEAKSTGAKVMCFASTISIAERMIRYGADAIVLEGSEAGGHIGHVSTIVLLQQLLFKYADTLPIFVAGGIATGRMAADLLLMGASGIQMGTRFVMTEECNVHPDFKQAFIRANARDAVSTPQFDSRLPVVAVRALRNQGTKLFGELQLSLLKKLEAGEISRADAQAEVEKFWVGALRRAAIDGDIANGSLMAGQSVGMMDSVKPIRDVIAEIISEADAEIARVSGLLA